jgi:class 3 adenylate cyclase
MSEVADDARSYAGSTFRSAWSIEDWERVPTEDDAIGLGNKGVRLDAVVLYADLRDSTGLVKDYTEEISAEIYKTYVYAAAKAIRFHDGSVTAYDGDRVMGVFIGDRKKNNAVDAAARIQALTSDVLQPEFERQYPHRDYTIRQKVGIDASRILVANTGIRGNNAYTWVGPAANNAAKMAGLKYPYYSTFVTDEIYDYLLDDNKLSRFGGGLMWSPPRARDRFHWLPVFLAVRRCIVSQIVIHAATLAPTLERWPF